MLDKYRYKQKIKISLYIWKRFDMYTYVKILLYREIKREILDLQINRNTIDKLWVLSSMELSKTTTNLDPY
jgi:hypothetical protein